LHLVLSSDGDECQLPIPVALPPKEEIPIPIGVGTIAELNAVMGRKIYVPAE
jgi:hypothetical protein